ncbi:RHS repeat-associated core domain-containing protein, partial [Paraburkholderia oxyphila]|uniref:RHS repeat-associated core domain-containing protein n=1 Tax=Paraburkholderia oxyphila TaxID=614212 RepID=UPI0005B7686D
TLGRFLQTDPVGYADDLNLYAYVKNNPVNLTDPGGMIASQSGSFANTSSPAAANVAAQSSTGGTKLEGTSISMPELEIGAPILVAGGQGMPRDHLKQNAQTRAVAVALKLTDEQASELHRWIGGQQMGYHEIMQEAKMLFNK